MTVRKEVVSVLAILPCREDRASLEEIFAHSKWDLHHAEALRPAVPLIEQVKSGVVITDDRLPDGTWRDVLEHLQRRRDAPPLVVVSRLADEALWAEVLNHGGFDVLPTPFEARAVIWSITVAWQHWSYKCDAKVAGSAAGQRDT